MGLAITGSALPVLEQQAPPEPPGLRKPGQAAHTPGMTVLPQLSVMVRVTQAVWSPGFGGEGGKGSPPKAPTFPHFRLPPLQAVSIQPLALRCASSY